MHTGDTSLNCEQSWGTLQARLQLSICPREATALIALEKVLTTVCIIFVKDSTLETLKLIRTCASRGHILNCKNQIRCAWNCAQLSNVSPVKDFQIDTNLGFTKDIYSIVRTKLGVPGTAHN